MNERPGPSDEARRLARAARAARTTRRTTRPGSEATDLVVGDPVRINREPSPSGSWRRYDGRDGWVASINRQTFPDGSTYVELGVCWAAVKDWAKASAEVWFRADEVTSR